MQFPTIKKKIEADNKLKFLKDNQNTTQNHIER